MARAATLFQSLVDGGMAAVRTLIEQRADNRNRSRAIPRPTFFR
jgi:hypothetical protein